ncbi:unnamed protein product [Cylicocyclus nassatus]|uniref:PDZ domain-containing protein n=1 Tax=Cylicocyclus nassatus TaxID=53992 RepID=A0AA36M552_CYLNA|nr:unnamed protein product [Cylicocyclus nassatus]
MPKSAKPKCCESTQLDTDELQESAGSETMKSVPPSRNKNIIRKKGFQYGLVRLYLVKGKRVGLGIKTHKDQVVVSKSQKDSICEHIIRRLDRIIDVNGTQVADRDVCREMLIKSLLKTNTVSLVIERPIEKEAIEAMERFLAEAGGQSAATSPVRDKNSKPKQVDPGNLVKGLKGDVSPRRMQSPRKGRRSQPPSAEDSGNKSPHRSPSLHNINDAKGQSLDDAEKRVSALGGILKKGSKLKAVVALKRK